MNDDRRAIGSLPGMATELLQITIERRGVAPQEDSQARAVAQRSATRWVKAAHTGRNAVTSGVYVTAGGHRILTCKTCKSGMRDGRGDAGAASAAAASGQLRAAPGRLNLKTEPPPLPEAKVGSP